MLCENCGKNEATVYMEKIINGVKTRMRLCPKCMAEQQKEAINAAFGMFSGFMEPSLNKGVCRKCGRSLGDIIETGFVGCPECYVEFGDRLNPIIKNVQSATVHTGKTPGGGGDAQTLAGLEAELRKAVKNENYEQADIISKKIKKIREETNEG